MQEPAGDRASQNLSATVLGTLGVTENGPLAFPEPTLSLQEMPVVGPTLRSPFVAEPEGE